MSCKVRAHHFYFVRLPYATLSAVKHHNVRCCWRYVHIVRFHCQDLIWYSIFLMQFEDGLMSAWLFLCFGMHAKMQMTWTSRSIRLKNNKNIPCSLAVLFQCDLCHDMLNWVVIWNCTEEQNIQLDPLSGVTKLNWTLYWNAIHPSFKLKNCFVIWPFSYGLGYKFA